jgi:hypothetical protein
MSADIFKEAERGADFSHHAKDIWPEVSWVFRAALFARNTKGLARVACSDAIHRATPWLAVEGYKICPNRCRIQGVFCHPRRQNGAGIGFDLNKTDCASSWLRQSNAEVESADTSAQGQYCKGT